MLDGKLAGAKFTAASRIPGVAASLFSSLAAQSPQSSPETR
jgi:hypothetical protein